MERVRVPVPDLVIAVMQGRTDIGEQGGNPRLALDQRPHADVLAVEVQKIEQEEHERRPRAGVRLRRDR